MAIARYDGSQRALVPTTEWSPSGWIHVEDPTPAERASIAEHLGVAEEFLDHALDIDEIARVDRMNGTRLVVLRIPYATHSTREAPFRTIALGIVFTKRCVLTICRKHAAVIKPLAEHPELDVEHHERFLLFLLLCLAEQYLACVREVDRAVEVLEEQLQQSQRNREVYELLRCQKALVHFKTALGSNRIVVDRLQHDATFPFGPEDSELLADVLVELTQANEMAAVSSNILGEMMDAFASIISNNLNVVMKALTALTILVALPTLVASFYGMNVTLPGAQRPDAFTLIAAASLVLVSVVAIVFMRKRWL